MERRGCDAEDFRTLFSGFSHLLEFITSVSDVQGMGSTIAIAEYYDVNHRKCWGERCVLSISLGLRYFI